ncbi:50S ribosomal protein L37ae [Candidatus Woesearchaeota archaeon]|nr:50S ribosomal protein L37ae [Candidatus Woesearchaeota archaeon]
MASNKSKSVKRFGARYGRTTRLRYGEIEQLQRKLHRCPYCHNVKVKRISVGIWHCKKCNAKFTGKAYTI